MSIRERVGPLFADYPNAYIVKRDRRTLLVAGDDLALVARLVAQWNDNGVEWPVPPPLNAELDLLAAAVERWKQVTG